MRVVCEFCQTVYNIPDEKLVRDKSQATCKVCKNKILIRRTPATAAAGAVATARSVIPGSPSTDPTLPRVPTATPTRISDVFPASPPALATTEPSAPAAIIPGAFNAPDPGGFNAPDEPIHETELSNSWREAIVDNRGTIDMLRKTGVPVPALTSTAAGPAVRSPSPEDDDEAESEPTVAEPLPPPRGWGGVAPLVREPSASGIALDAGPSLEIDSAPKPPGPRPVVRSAAAAAPRAAAVSASSMGRDGDPGRSPVQREARYSDPRASSAAISLGGSFVSAAAAAALVHNGGWGLGLSGLAALGACAFTASALALDAAVRRRGPIAVIAITIVAGLAAAGTATAVLVTGGARTRALAAEHPFLAPFAGMTSRGVPPSTPSPVPSETPVAADPEPEDTVLSTPDEPPVATPDDTGAPP